MGQSSLWGSLTVSPWNAVVTQTDDRESSSVCMAQDRSLVCRETRDWSQLSPERHCTVVDLAEDNSKVRAG